MEMADVASLLIEGNRGLAVEAKEVEFYLDPSSRYSYRQVELGAKKKTPRY